MVVLVGPNTLKRKHVDWEIYAGLSASINGSSGLVGVLLPEFHLTQGGDYYTRDLPARLGDNVHTGYADIYTWNYFINNFDSILKVAFENRIRRKCKIDNSRKQMQYNKM